MPPFLRIDSLAKRFGDVTVVEGLDLEVAEGELLALVGPSGSGKTTLLRLLAGFEEADAGQILLRGEELTRTPPARRRFGVVFQHYALFPHLSVGENVAFGLSSRSKEREAVRSRVAEVLRLVDLAGFEGRRVAELSGGQQQRVALARALAPEPCLLLLDEPLSSLDPSLRQRTRIELAEAIRRVGLTTVLVTHDPEEAFELGDRVAVMWEGRLAQVAPPEEVYRRPASPAVASFVGRVNVLRGRVEGGAGEMLQVRLAGAEAVWTVRSGEGGVGEEEVEIVLRPEELSLDGAEGVSLAGRIVGQRFLGPLTYQVVELDSGPSVEVLAERPPRDRVAVSPRGSGAIGWAFGVGGSG